MENASKALIIAGAILLAILIISLGIMVYNQARGAIDTNSMNDVEIQQFNQKFTQYEGSAVRGATVRSMVQAVWASNTSQDDARKIKVLNGNTDITSSNSDISSISNGKTYKVKCSYSTNGSNKGLVNQISITAN